MKKPRSNPEIEARLLDAHARGVPIDDLEYDEVTGLLDVVLARTKAAAAEGTAKVREAAKTIASTSGTGLRRVV